MSDAPLILCADDDEDILSLVSLRLERAGFDVVKVGDGEAAIAAARERQPAVAVLDVMMPKLTGLDVTRRLRENPVTQHILVMLISAGFEHNEIWGLPAGADDYVKKPFGPQELPNRVEAVLAR